MGCLFPLRIDILNRKNPLVHIDFKLFVAYLQNILKRLQEQIQKKVTKAAVAKKSEKKDFGASTGFEPVASALALQCSTSLSYEDPYAGGRPIY